MQWQIPRWRPKYQKPLKSPFLNLQMEWTSSDVAHSETMCSSVGSENSASNKKSASPYGFENTAATNLDRNLLLGCREARC